MTSTAFAQATRTVGTVRAATAADNDAVSSVLALAFAADPVFAWVTPDAVRRAGMLPDFFTLFAAAYEPLGAGQVIDGSEGTVGAALWAPPGQQAIGEEDADEVAGRIEVMAGPDTGRMFEVMGLLEEHHPDAACYYLNLLGVDPARHGGGLGSTLLDAGLARCDREGQPAYLEATSVDNRRLYARHGFEVIGEITLPDGPSLWPMWREPVRWGRALD
jgi:GNAT superfamily N-acetyltransferase